MSVPSISNPELKRYVQYVKELARKFSRKYGLPDEEDVESYAVTKLAIILPKLTGENNFGFIQVSINGYLLNYIRDTYNKNKYPRKICFLKKKYSLLKEEEPDLSDKDISKRLGCSVQDLKTIEDSLYSIYFEDNYWVDSFINPSQEFLSTLEESNYSLLVDFTNAKISAKDLVKKYGKDCHNTLIPILTQLEELETF